MDRKTKADWYEVLDSSYALNVSCNREHGQDGVTARQGCWVCVTACLRVFALVDGLLAADGGLGLPEGGGPLPLQLAGLLGFLLPLGQDLRIFSSSQTVLLGTPPLQGNLMPLALQNHGSDETLDLGGLEPLLLTLLLGKRPLDDVLANIILGGQVEKLTDLGSPLGSKPPGHSVVGESRDLSLALLDDGHGEDGQVTVHDASTHRLTLALSSTTGPVAGMVLGEQQTHTLVGEHSLLHGETLLVVSTGNPQNVSLELFSECIGIDLLAHPLLVERTNLQLIVDLDEFLAPGGRVGEINLHFHATYTLSCRSESSNISLV